MKKLIKVFVYLILTVVAVIVLAIGGIIMFVNPNQFKPQITELVQKNANVLLTIDGDIEWTFYPWLGIKVQNITVASPNTPTVPVANIRLAQASILFKSLLSRELNISDVVVDGLSVTLLKDAEGNSNWILPESKAQVSADQSSTDQQSTQKTQNSQSTQNLYVKSISIQDANFIYKDAQKNQAIALKNLNVTTGEVMLNQPIKISMKGDYALFNPKIEGSLELSSIVDYNGEKSFLQVRDLQLKNNVNVDGQLQLLTQVSTLLEMDLKSKLVQLSNLSIESSGKIQDLNIHQLNIQGLVKADLNREILNVDQLMITMNDLQLKGKVIAEQYSSEQLKFTGQLNSNVFNLKQLLSQLKITLPAFEMKNALEKVSIQLSMNGNLKNIDINPLQIHFDETKVAGSSAIILDKVPTIALALKGDQLVVDHYLPPKSKQKTGNSTAAEHPSAKAPENPELIPVLPKTINIIADIQWDRLTLDQLQLTQNKFKGSLKNGDATLEQLVTNIYGGTVSLNGSLKGGQKAQLSVNGQVNKIDLTKVVPQISLKNYINSDLLLSRLNQNHKNISVEGVLNSKFTFKTSGRLQNQVIANLNGDANFELNQGRVNNLNYEKLMCQGIALLNQKALTDSFNRTYTDFQKLYGKVTIRNGIVNNDPFQMVIPGLTMNGKGDINLNRMTIDYRMNAILTGDHSFNPDPACQINQKFKNIAIPLICEGSLEKTEGLCRLDTDQLGKTALEFGANIAKDKVKKELDQQRDKVQEKLEGEIEKQIKKNPAIKGLLKNIL